MQQSKLGMAFLNVGHFFDHLFLLIFATAALTLITVWGISYAQLIPYTTPALVVFGIGALPAGWLADKWSRKGMLVVFFIGIGVSSILTSLANTPLQMAIYLTFIGMFAAIYHPVGLAMVVQGLEKTGVPLAVNGVFGNMGVACAALFTGYLVDSFGWRSAFALPGVVSIAIGVLYFLLIRSGRDVSVSNNSSTAKVTERLVLPKSVLIRIFAIILFTAALGGLIFQSTTFALPKVFDEKLMEIAGSATLVGRYAFLVFTIAAFAQLIVGYLLDNGSVRTIFAAVALLQATFFFIMTQTEGILALLIAIAFMFVVFGQIPINDVLVGRIAHSEWRSRAYALSYVVTFTVSATAIPLIAWIHNTRGFNFLFVVLGVAAFLVCLAALLLPKIKETSSTWSTANV